MNTRELQRYLERIGMTESALDDAELLAAIQRAHLAAVPFENLDIAAGRIPLALDEAALFDKIVERRRGGICYELNLLLAAALRALGYKVHLKGGRHPKYGDDMDHLFLLVETPTRAGFARRSTEGAGLSREAREDALGGAPWLVDVGFAANFAEPLRLIVGKVQDDGIDRYLIEDACEVGVGYLRLLRIPGLSGDAPAQEMFTFAPQSFTPDDCRERCDWFCTAEESRFTQGPLVTRQEANGRITLSGRHFIETRDGRRTSISIDSPEEFDRFLMERFELTR